MKIKKIMLITLLLLAVLTIGAVSAADDVASDNMTVTDDASEDLSVDDAVADDEIIGVTYEDNYHEINVNDVEEGLDTEDETEVIADICIPNSVKGSFRIYNGDVIVASQDFKAEDETDDDEEYGWYDDGEDITGYITMDMFNLNKVNNGDVLTFKFFELKNNQYTVVDMFTLEYKVSLTDSTLLLTEVGGSDSGMDEYDVNIQVSNVNTTQPDENFTYVDVAKKAGFFIIVIETEDDEEIILMEDLSTTDRAYVQVKDENDDSFYRFGFSFTDINNYLSQNTVYSSFNNLVEVENVESGNEITFYLSEDADYDENEIDSKLMTLTFRPDGMILFKDENDDVDVDYDYDNMEITINEGWQDLELLTFIVKYGIKGKIVIYLNNNETPVFEKNIKDLNESDDDGEFYYYTITIGDLNINQAGEYLIQDYFVNEAGDTIYKYDEEYPETLKVHENQTSTVDNVTIDIEPTSMYVTGTEHFITISANASADEIVEISIDGSESIPINLNATRRDGDDNYIIGTEELKFRPSAGLHTVNITYRNQNRSGNITLLSHLNIEIEDNETVYTTFQNIFVYFTLEDNEILQSDIKGLINVTIIDADGKVVETFLTNITELDSDEDSYIICADANNALNGTYEVIIRYFNGNEIDTQAQANVTFKAFEAKDCGAEIIEFVKDKNDYAITFTSVPKSGKINVEIDGANTVTILEDDLDGWFDEEKMVHYIRFNKLGELSDGTHSITVYVTANGEDIILATGNVLVDVIENIDPELEISIANITEGKDAIINIKTHSNFSGIVPVKIDNNTYNVNVTNGTGSLAVPGLAVGKYNATAVFEANVFYNASTKNTTFNVNAKVATAISAADIPTTYATSKNIIVTLKDANGNALAEKEVNVVFNGVAKNLKTDSNGQVSLAIGTKLAPNTYPVTFSFAGDDELLASSGSAKVTVKKAKAKITAKKKTFKAKKKSKKYKITLKTDKKKALKKAKVTITVKGKGKKVKITKKTNSKGKATFNLKKLTKKGKYKATVKFAGDKYYNKVTKKIKITIK